MSSIQQTDTVVSNEKGESDTVKTVSGSEEHTEPLQTDTNEISEER